MINGVALMESPRRAADRARTSTGSSTIIRGSETESNLDYFEAIHSVDIHNNAAFAYGDASVMTTTNHELLKSPVGSLAPTTATTASTNKQKYRVLGTTSLIAILYLATAGGPVGSESLISTGGPLLGLLGIVTYVVLCEIPIALMITELCCAFPENGGFSVWTLTAFGPFWGFQSGYWAWIVSVINNAIYPGIIYETISNALGVEPKSGFVVYLFKVLIACLLALPSYLGVRFIGIASLVMLTLVVMCTTIFCVWGFAVSEGAFVRLGETRTLDGSNPDGDNVDWSLLIHSLFWNFSGIHWISIIGGEVRNPARTYPRVIFFTVVIATLVYALPFISAVTAGKTPWREMLDSTYPDIAEAIGGSVLQGLVVFTSVVSLIGLYSNCTFLQMFLVQGMAQSQLLPAILRKRSARFQTPKYALLVSLIATIVVLGLNFETILRIFTIFSSMVQIMIVFSLLQLRRVFPHLQRPMRMPGNLVTIMVMLLPAMCMYGFAIWSTLSDGKAALFVLAFVFPGIVFPYVRQWIAGRRLCG